MLWFFGRWLFASLFSCCKFSCCELLCCYFACHSVRRHARPLDCLCLLLIRPNSWVLWTQVPQVGHVCEKWAVGRRTPSCTRNCFPHTRRWSTCPEAIEVVIRRPRQTQGGARQGIRHCDYYYTTAATVDRNSSSSSTTTTTTTTTTRTTTTTTTMTLCRGTLLGPPPTGHVRRFIDWSFTSLLRNKLLVFLKNQKFSAK